MSRPIYEIVQEIMDERELTVAEIARLCDLPDSTVRGIMTRKQKSVALEVAFKMSDGLGVSLNYLNGKTDKKIPPAPAEAEAEEKARIEEYASRVIDALVSLGFLTEHKDLTPRQRIVVSAVLQILAVEFGQAEGSTEYWDKVV